MKIQNFLLILTYLICMNFDSIVSKKYHTELRIVGGRKTDIKSLGGFLVAIRVRGSFICAGSYVSRRIVISAAHCVEETMDFLDLMTIQGGISNLKENGPRIPVERVLVPENYNDIDNDLDVAVILLKKPLRNHKVRKIHLCDHVLQKNDIVSVYGWGLGNHSDNQHKFQVETIDIPVITRRRCTKKFKKMGTITESMLCAGVPYEKDACQYDSGGPLVHKGQLCGVVSFGVNCASEYPGVYADVKYLSRWIKKSIKELLS